MPNLITPIRIKNFNLPLTIEPPVTLTAKETPLDFNDADCRILIKAESADVLVKAGNSCFAGADLLIPANSYAVIDSGRFKLVSGENRNCIVLKGEGAKITAVTLP